MNKLFIDCKTDQEKYNFFLSGRAHETGVIAASMQNDVAMAYQRCVSFQDELRRLHEINQELVEALTYCRMKIAYMTTYGEWYSPELAIEKADAALNKAGESNE